MKDFKKWFPFVKITLDIDSSIHFNNRKMITWSIQFGEWYLFTKWGPVRYENIDGVWNSLCYFYEKF